MKNIFKHENNKIIRKILMLIVGISILVVFVLLLTRNNISKIDYQDEEINLLIEKYDLENIRNDINKNKDFFLKYANVVLNNQNILYYQHDILSLYKVVIDNSDSLDEEYFLTHLGNLSIKIETNDEFIKNNNFSGLYSFGEDKITLSKNLTRERESVFYHEFLHFIDDVMGEKQQICLYNNIVYTADELKKIGVNECSSFSLVPTNFIVEGGAEYYSIRYMYGGNLTPSSYTDFILYIKVLERAIGYERTKNMFFSPDTTYLFYQLLVKDYNYTIEEIEALIMELNLKNDDTIVSDIIIDLCNYLKIKWYDDKDIRFIVSRIIDGVSIDDLKSSKYYEECLKYYDKQKELLNDLIDKAHEKIHDIIPLDSYIRESSSIIENGKVYLLISIYPDDISDVYYFRVLVDIDKKDIVAINRVNI